MIRWVYLLVLLYSHSSRPTPVQRSCEDPGHNGVDPTADNVSSDTGLLTQWPSEGPPLRWNVKGIGKGIAAAAVAGGQIIMLGGR